MKSFDQQVADWAASKPADAKYDYGSVSNCAMCQFLRENGFADQPRVGGYKWRDRFADGTYGPYVSLSPGMEVALVEEPRTFSALAARLRIAEPSAL